MSNLELFDKYIEKVFSILSENFPVMIDLTLEDLTGLSLEEQYILPQGDSWMSTLVADACIAKDTVIWLKDNGYVDYEKYGRDFVNIRLTEKGLKPAGVRLHRIS